MTGASWDDVNGIWPWTWHSVGWHTWLLPLDSSLPPGAWALNQMLNCFISWCVLNQWSQAALSLLVNQSLWMPTTQTSSAVLWAATDLWFTRDVKAASVSLGMFLFTSVPSARVRLVNGHWSPQPTFPFQKPWEAVLRLRISVHEQLMFYMSLPLEQACRIQNFTPPDPASWYTNQLFRYCKHPELSSSLS